MIFKKMDIKKHKSFTPLFKLNNYNNMLQESNEIAVAKVKAHLDEIDSLKIEYVSSRGLFRIEYGTEPFYFNLDNFQKMIYLEKNIAISEACKLALTWFPHNKISSERKHYITPKPYWFVANIKFCNVSPNYEHSTHYKHLYSPVEGTQIKFAQISGYYDSYLDFIENLKLKLWNYK